MDLDKFFNPKTIAIVGVSKDSKKVGHVIFRNFLDSGYKGRILIVNPNEEEILGKKCYPSVSSIKEKIDLAVIALPALITIKVVEECGKAGIKNLILVAAGFEEVGNVKLKNDLLNLLKKYNIKAIGPNCLGIHDTHTKVDTIFNPTSRMKRPEQGDIGLISQSGAVGIALLDRGTDENYKFSKFISYGNAISIDEADFLEYLGNDPKTKVICMYIEGVKDGKKFLRIAKNAASKKPVIVVKGGSTEEGSKATLSHTGSLAGSDVVYKGAFKQAGIIQADSLEELFEYAKIFMAVKPKGNRVQVITNGGGYGILCTDAIINNDLKMAEMDESRKQKLKKQFPDIVVVKNPFDLTGSTTTKWYETAIRECLQDKNIDILLVVALYQTPLITTDLVDVISEFNTMKKKPIIVVSTGSSFTNVLSTTLEENGVPVYTFPNNAVKAIRKLVDFYTK